MSEIRVDNILSADGTAAPVYSKGISVAAGQTFTNAGDFTTSGTATISGNTTISGPVVYSSGATITGVTTFNSDFNNINITGITTFNDGIIVSGVTTFNSDLDNANFTGISTFNNNVKFQEGLNVTGVVTFTDLSIQSGVTTFSGNVSVGGTLTYEDVTSVDSLGIVTARTGVKVTAGGIDVTAGGIDVTDGGIDVTGGIALSGAGVLTIADTTQSTSKDTGSIITNGGVGIEKNLNVGTAVTISGAGIATFSQGMKVGGGNALQEKCHIESQAWSRPNAGDNDINLDYGMVQLVTGDVLAGTGNTININYSVGINTKMVNGDIIAVTGITSVNASTDFVNTLQIDHSTVQVAWAGGSVPSAGSSTGYDVYAFNIIKTASATYAVIGNQIKAG